MILSLVKFAVFAALIGFITAGFVWYGWGLARNTSAAFAIRRARKLEEAASEEA